jgi:hypothetical protein
MSQISKALAPDRIFGREDEELQFTHEPETQGQQEDNSDKKGVCNHSWFLSVGEFNSLSPKLTEWHGKRALRPLATEALRSAPFIPGANADGEDSGVKESPSQNERTNMAR